MQAEGSRLHLSCEAAQGVCCEVHLIAAELSEVMVGALYEMALNRDSLS